MQRCGNNCKKKDKLPIDIAADEKHSWIRGEKIYIPTTVAKGCILGAEACPEADATNLTQGYKVFADEAKNVDPYYLPTTVNTDGWEATKIAFKTLFAGIVIIRCFLHAFIKVRDCSKKLNSFTTWTLDKNHH